MGYYAIKVRKDIAIAIPILIVLLTVGYYATKAVWNWEPDKPLTESFEKQSEEQTKPESIDLLDCAEFQKQLDQEAQNGLRDGYVCQKKIPCQVPEGLSFEERNKLKEGRKSQGFYFETRKYVASTSANRNYYIETLTGSYACTEGNLALLKKFSYEQQWKAGNIYGE